MRQPQTCDQKHAKGRLSVISELIEARRNELLKHRYFELCRSGALGRSQLLEIIKQLYCFGEFYERLLSFSITDQSDAAARMTLALELPTELGVAPPTTLTKAMFAYLCLALQHEHSQLLNVAVVRVFESVAVDLFAETQLAVERCSKRPQDSLSTPYFSGASAWLELAPSECDQTALCVCRRVIDDVYRLLTLVLDDWLATDSTARRQQCDRARLN